jgi:hypothetical protein
MSDSEQPLSGISQAERRAMLGLLKLKPEKQKAATPPVTAKGEAQRRRREKEATALRDAPL